MVGLSAKIMIKTVMENSDLKMASLEERMALLESRIKNLEEILVANGIQVPVQETASDTAPVEEECSATEVQGNGWQEDDVYRFEAREEAVPGKCLADAAPETVQAVMDRMRPDRPDWMSDIPGMHVEDVRGAVSLNDRLLFVSSLFGGDAELFEKTLDAINSSADFSSFCAYAASEFPEWDMSSDTVYRFMMAARRRLE